MPIAQYYIARGYEVFWPVDGEFMPFAQKACPAIHFIAIDPLETERHTHEYFYQRPLREIAAHGCTEHFSLYSYLSGLDVFNTRLAESLKFDEYKYAVSNVPFAQKWRLRLERDRAAEARLVEQLDIGKNRHFFLRSKITHTPVFKNAWVFH